MHRDLPIGNGNVLIDFDDKYRISEIYYPRVGEENHSLGINHFGVWVDGQFAWVQDGWNVELRYLKDTLVTDVLLQHAKFALQIRVHDLVDCSSDVLLREFHISDLSGQDRKVRLFFHQNFDLSEAGFGDRACHDSPSGGVIHCNRHEDRWFLVNAKSNGRVGVSQWAIGLKKEYGEDGTFRDAEDGLLCCNAEIRAASATVDSTVSINIDLPATGEVIAHYWLCFGRTNEVVTALDNSLRGDDLSHIGPRNQNYWRYWINSRQTDFLGLPAKVVHLYKRSLLVIRSETDNGGAIKATYNGDVTGYDETYSYSWPRDGALVAYALSEAGYRDLAERFFIFCNNDLMKDAGYLLYTRQSDWYEAAASSVYPWQCDGLLDEPIHEDETALVLWSLWQHFSKYRDIEFVRTVFDKLLIRGADFLVRYRDPETKLPRPSLSFRHQRYELHLSTVASVIAGLTAATKFCHALGEISRANHYQEIADEVRTGMLKYMWSDREKRFCRMATRCEGGYELDMNVEAAMCAIFAFGVLSPQDEKVVATMQAIENRFWSKTIIGDCARLENDGPARVCHDTEEVPAKTCFICTMWLAQYKIASARSREHLREPLEMLEWVVDHALPSGVLTEQVHFCDNHSVAPHTSSHASFVTSVLDYLRKHSQMDEQMHCLRSRTWMMSENKPALKLKYFFVHRGTNDK